jgi:hypothetical protein
MKSLLIAAYVAGAAVTAVNLKSTQVFRGQYLMNGLVILLWPLYWACFLTMWILDRRRG